MGVLTPVFRPPLKGVPARNLDGSSLGVPPQAQCTREKPSEVPDIRAIITSVLKELGLVGKGAVTQQEGETPAALNPTTKGKKGKKGKLSPSTTAATARRADDQERKATKQAKSNTSTQQVETDTRAQQEGNGGT